MTDFKNIDYSQVEARVLKAEMEMADAPEVQKLMVEARALAAQMSEKGIVVVVQAFNAGVKIQALSSDEVAETFADIQALQPGYSVPYSALRHNGKEVLLSAIRIAAQNLRTLQFHSGYGAPTSFIRKAAQVGQRQMAELLEDTRRSCFMQYAAETSRAQIKELVEQTKDKVVASMQVEGAQTGRFSSPTSRLSEATPQLQYLPALRDLARAHTYPTESLQVHLSARAASLLAQEANAPVFEPICPVCRSKSLVHDALNTAKLKDSRPEAESYLCSNCGNQAVIEL